MDASKEGKVDRAWKLGPIDWMAVEWEAEAAV